MDFFLERFPPKSNAGNFVDYNSNYVVSEKVLYLWEVMFWALSRCIKSRTFAISCFCVR
jgi:hypothetical protein